MPGFELIGDEERKAVNDLFDDGGVLFAHGFDNIRNNKYRVRDFEKKFANYLGVKYAQAVSSGTAALKISLRVLNIGPGDEVITQSFTFIAVAEAIIEVGAKPVFINIDKSLNMDPEELESAINQNTKAIIPVHMLGVAADQDKIKIIANKNNIPVIEDSCECLGAEWENNKLGIQFDMSAWSFDSGKTIIAGEGGMITTNNEDLYKLSREIHDHGHMYRKDLPRGKDTHRVYGFNYRMTEIQAAIVSSQLDKIEYIVSKNRSNYKIYYDELSQIKEIEFRKIPKKCKPLCDTLILSFENKNRANSFLKFLLEQSIGTKNVPDAIEWHYAIYWDHMLNKIGISHENLKLNLKKSTEILEKTIALPIMVKETDKIIMEKINKIKKFF